VDQYCFRQRPMHSIVRYNTSELILNLSLTCAELSSRQDARMCKSFTRLWQANACTQFQQDSC
jgi:hypothetical protein